MTFLFFSDQPPLSSQDTNIKLAEFDIDLLEGMFIVLGYTYLFYAMLDPRLILRANVRINSLQFVCVYNFCFRTIFQRAFQLFFAMQFCSTTKKNLKETPIGFYIQNLWSCHPLPFLLMLCMKTNRFRYSFVLKDYVFSLINIWVCPKLFHLVKRIKTRGIGIIG